MKLIKDKKVFGAIFLSAILVFVIYILVSRGSDGRDSSRWGVQMNNDPLSDADVMKMNIKDDATLVRSVHNIFVGKVIQEIGKKDYRSRPHTQFDVAVIYNIKGNLGGVAKVNQEGAYVNGVLKVSRVDGPIENQTESYLLQPGYTYLLLTGNNPDATSYRFLGFNSLVIKVISRNQDLSNAQLDEIARSDQRVQELLAAYVNEAPGSAYNSFESLSESQKQAVYDKFQNLIPPRTAPTHIIREMSTSTPSVAENRLGYCMDGMDNDKDGLIDRSDPDCTPFLKENNNSLCRDNIDDDLDGLKDAADPDCAPFYPQPTPPPPPAPSSTPSSTLR